MTLQPGATVGSVSHHADPPADRRFRPATEVVSAMRLPAPDWLHHKLTISGEAAEVRRFRRAAAGAGITPWRVDLNRTKDHFQVAAEQRSLSVASGRILALELHVAVARRIDVTVSRVGQKQRCQFDLHAPTHLQHELLPVWWTPS